MKCWIRNEHIILPIPANLLISVWNFITLLLCYYST